MPNFRTWKQLQTTFISSFEKTDFNSFFKKELSDSRNIVRDVMNKKSRIRS